MKKLLLGVFTIFLFTYSQAQGVIAAKAGYNVTVFSAKSSYGNYSDSINGFYVGVVGEISIADIAIYPELLYVRVSEDGDSANFIQLPIMYYYEISEGLNLQAGPQINYLLEEKVENISNLGIDLALGASYDVKENIYVEARYALNLNNRYTGSSASSSTTRSSGSSSSSASIRYNSFQIGIGYRFD